MQDAFGRRRWALLGIPMAYAFGAVALGMLVPRLESRFLPDLAAPASASAALALLSAIASGVLPLTGLVFSLAFVMVQFSATAYSPRLVSWLAGSAKMHHTLGVFTATFLYALAAIVWVDREGSGKVPLFTMLLAIALLLVSVAFFMALVQRLTMLQITRVLAYTGDQGRAVIERDYPRSAAGERATGAPDAPDAEIALLASASQVLTHHGGPATIQTVDVRRLSALASRAGAVVSLGAAVGDTLVSGMPILRVHGPGPDLPERQLRRCVRLGSERTFEQDPKYAIRILVDIAIRALSPAVNDPTTAVQALDQIEDLLVRLGQRELSIGRARDAQGRARVLYPAPSWEDFLVLAFDEIRYCGANSIQVMRRMRALIRSLIEHVPVERRAALQKYLDRVDAGIARAFEDGDDRRDALQEDRQGLGLSREHRTP
jgi:uncharacterized membrane protein